MMHFLFDTPYGGTDAHHDNWLVHLEPQLTRKQ
jgi:hypothetical protein